MDRIETSAQEESGNRSKFRPSTCFKPGQSGNPSGRPKVDKTLKALAREHTAAAIERLAAIMNDKGASPSAQVAAATALLDRGHGKPLQQLEVGDAGAFSDMDDKALDAFIANASLKLSGEARAH